jgi:hypothetical protein
MISRISFAERYRQARLYAAQVRKRREMGARYEHAAPWRGPSGIKSVSMNISTNRKLEHA